MMNRNIEASERRNMYHIVFFSVPPEKRGEVPKIIKALEEVAEKFKGVQSVGLFFPRGSGYMYATITKYQDYATWEKYWRSPEVTAVREKAIAIITKQMDMFFDEPAF